MSRLKSRTRGRWATFLWAGAVTQVVAAAALAAPVGALTAPEAAPGGPPVVSPGVNPRAAARAKLTQARAQLAQGNFDTAESLAREAARPNLTFSAGEDSPAKVLREIQSGRQDPKLLLAASRSALARKDLVQAEKYARLAEKNSSLFTFPVWSDSPSAALKEIARAKKAGPTVTATGDRPKGPTPPPGGKAGDEARELIRQARAALTANRLDEARRLTALARARKPNLGWWEDNPERLEGDMRRLESRGKRAPTIIQTGATAVVKDPAPKASPPRTKEEARSLVTAGRRQLAEGKIEEAVQSAQRAKALTTVSWGLFEDSPDRLSIDVGKARAERDRTESVRLLDEGRKLYARGDLDGASRAAYRAQKLHGPYSIWDLGDRPSKLLSDVHTAQAKARQTALPPAAVVRNPTRPAGDFKGPGSFTKPTPPVERTTTPGLPSGLQVANDGPGTTPTRPAAPAETVAPDKLRAGQLVAEAQRLHREGRLMEAQKKAAEAQRLGVTFAADEVGPDSVYQQIALDVRQKIDAQMRQAHDSILYGPGDLATRYHTAEAKLEQARGLAQNFGQDLRPIEQRLAEVRELRAGHVPGSRPRPATAPAEATVRGPSPEQKMLEQARAELLRGEVATARRLAEQAMMGAQKGQPAVREEASAMLRTVDVEEFKQKRLATQRSFDAAMAAFRRREYPMASAMIAALDLRLLSPDQQGRLREVSLTPEMTTGTAAARAGAGGPAADGPTPGIVRTGGTGPTGAGELPAVGTPGRASASDGGDGDGGLLDQHRARQQILVDKWKRDALDVQREAADRFRAGQHDEALEKLQDFITRLEAERIEPGQVAALRRPVESRLNSYKVMKAQIELQSGRLAARQSGMDAVRSRQKAIEQKQKNVESLMKQFHALYKSAKYVEAEGVASRILEIDPDNAVAAGAVNLARMHRNLNASQQLTKDKRTATLNMLNDADSPGDTGLAIDRGGEAFNKKAWDRAGKRTAQTPIELGRPSKAEKAIERQLGTPISVSFENTPLKTVITELRDIYNINIVPDMPALMENGVSMDSPISMKLHQISLKSALNLILRQVKLTHIIKDDVLQITTEEHAQGKLKTVTYPIADLVIPIDNAGPGNSPLAAAASQLPNGSGYTPTPFTSGGNGLGGATPVGTPLSASANSGANPGAAGTTTTSSGNGGMSAKLTQSTSQQEQLIQLITRSIAPRSWGDMGGQATIEYHPMTMALVVNQTVDIQEQIQDLLASLRRLQDQEVAVEVRFISVTEDFFERIGVKFDVNILNKGSTKYQPALLNNAFVSNSSNFINNFQPKSFISGLTPAGTLTPDLNIPITNNSFLQAIPNFGGYASGGGLSLGLAFLSDIQVFLFMEAVQGDTRANVMQAPKLTMFNGQRATLQVSEDQFYLTQIQLVQVPNTGQYALVPQNVALQNQQVSLVITPIISSDRRFVRMNLQPFLQNIVPGSLQTQAPVAVPIFTSNDNTASGQPVLVTQYLQQPAFTSVSVNTTVVVPDGGTVVMGGLKRLAESRNEFGPPILSKIPYINRLFKNVGYGRTTESLLIMVTPRIIIQEEEERIQTGVEPRAFAAP